MRPCARQQPAIQPSKMPKTSTVAPQPVSQPRSADNTSLETLTEEMISDLEVAFRLFDSDGSGTKRCT